MVRFIGISLLALATACSAATEADDVRTDVGHNDEVAPLTVSAWAETDHDDCSITFHAAIGSHSTEPGSGTVTVGDWRWAEFAVAPSEWQKNDERFRHAYTSRVSKLPAGPWPVQVCVQQADTGVCSTVHVTSKCAR